MQLVRLTSDRYDDVVEALCDAFRDYPVMRYVIGDVGDRYASHLRQLVGYFTQARFCRAYPVLGIESGGRIVAAANVNPPHTLPAPPELERAYDALRESLGTDAIERYKAFAAVCEPFSPEGLHFHLGMIGVAHTEQRHGHARRLLEAVHELSFADPESSGVSLTTEMPANLSFYEHFGYRVLGHGTTPDGELVSWTLFRGDDPRG
jgi:GNAT superfamily N-acetyltransferase